MSSQKDNPDSFVKLFGLSDWSIALFAKRRQISPREHTNGDAMRLPENKPTRKQRFNAALDLAGLTVAEWRSDYYAVSAQHLNEVLNGDREPGAELNAAIDKLIAKYLPDIAA